MLTFDGKSASFVPGKENPNKEPAVSKFVVEKLYKVHRERIRDMEPVIETTMEIPDFMQNTGTCYIMKSCYGGRSGMLM